MTSSAFILVELIAFGLIFGSFVNALVWRLHTRRNFVNERSECPHCHHILAAKDLIPVASFVLLRGKCRYCHEPIEDTPLAELMLPSVWVLSYIFWPISLQGSGLFLFGIWLLVCIAFVALAIYDLRWYLLPNKIVFPLIGTVAAQIILMPVLYHYDWRTVFDAALGALVLSGLFYILFQISDGAWIGGGDVKLAIALGLLAGDPLRSCLLLFFASLAGTVVALPAFIRGGGKARGKIKLPFGPLLIMGTILVQLFGSDVVNWYIRVLSV